MLYRLAFIYRSSNTKTSQCFGVNLKIVQRIRKESGESIDNYEGTTTQKPHFDRSDLKRILVFIGKIEAMTD